MPDPSQGVPAPGTYLGIDFGRRRIGVAVGQTTTATARPLAIPPNFFYFHFPAMIIILYSFRFFISINREGFFRKWQGAWLLGLYGVYVFLQYALNVGTSKK